jgi:hypothetical protein
MWLMDSSCSRHMTGDKKWFSVTFGDDKKGKVFGTDIIELNDHFTFNDVALVDKLKYNLLSVSQLVDAIWMCFFTRLVREFLTLLAILFVIFLALVRSFKLICHLLNLL